MPNISPAQIPNPDIVEAATLILLVIVFVLRAVVYILCLVTFEIWAASLELKAATMASVTHSAHGVLTIAVNVTGPKLG